MSGFYPVPQEIFIAATWWRNLLTKNLGISHVQGTRFFETLVSLLSKKIMNHWHPTQPLRGQAYRAISYDIHYEIDKTLAMAAEAAQITNIRNCFPHPITHVIMWIDPDEVVVKFFVDGWQSFEVPIFHGQYNGLVHRKFYSDAVTVNS